MRGLTRFFVDGRTLPIIVSAIILLLLAGGAAILQNEAVYQQQAERETRAKAEILAASVTAALDFSDLIAVQEAVDTVRVDRQIRAVRVYDDQGAFVAGYERQSESLRGDQVEIERAQAQHNLIVTRVPVTSMGDRLGTVELLADRESTSNRFARLFLIALLVIMATLVVAVLGVGQLALRAANRELRQRAEALADTNQELQVQMEERHKAEDQLRQAHKMQAIGQLTGGIAHDFNNLLTVIQGSAEILGRKDLNDAKRMRYVDALAQAADRAAALTNQLLAFSRRQALKPEVIDTSELVMGLTDLLDRTLGDAIEVRTELHCDPCKVEADRAQLESAILNLAVNARDAMPDGGLLSITSEPLELDGVEMVAISIHDEGMGIDEEILSRVLEPFFTTKETGRGTGLGLSQVYGFATQSGGDLQIESTPGEGTTVRLLLPHSDAEADEQKARSELPRVPRTGTILLVEDNDEVAAFAADLLRDLGYTVVRAANGNEALDRVANSIFDLVFSDVMMPGMTGIALADELEKLRPDLPVLLTTGYSSEIVADNEKRRSILQKPYRGQDLANAIDKALGAEKKNN